MRRRRVVVGLALVAALAGLVVARLREAGAPCAGGSGPLLCTIALGPRVGSIVVDGSGGRAFAGSEAGAVTLLDTRRLQVLRTVMLGGQGEVLAVDAPAEGVVVAHRDAGTLSILDAQTLVVRHTVAVGMSPGVVAVDAQTGRAFVSSATGLSVVNIRDGTVLRTLPVDAPVGATAQPVAIEPSTHQVFVIDATMLRVLDATNGRVRHTIMLGQYGAAVVLGTPGRALVLNSGAR